MSEEALQVKSSLKNNKFYVDVQNLLLQEPYPLIGYIYLSESNSTFETVAQIRISLKQRKKPSDYYYINNVDFVVSYQVGSFEFTTGSTAGAKTYTLTFPNKFKSIPAVFATINQSNSQNYAVSIINKSQTGATICIYNNANVVDKKLPVSLMAIIP